MNRKLVLALALTLLVGLLSVAFNVQRAEAGGTIYIRADGSIDPPTALISTVNNVVYTLTDNIFGDADADGIVVERSNIAIDGNGYTLQGTGIYDSKGIYFSDINNVTIRNTNIRGFYYGIYLNSTSYNVISGNSITNNVDGILVWNQTRSGFWLEFNYGSSNNVISTNHIVENNGSGVVFAYSSDNVISQNNITNNQGCGIEFDGSPHNIIARNNITNNVGGIRLAYNSSSNNTLSENYIMANEGYGISLYGSSNNAVFGNNIVANSGAGIGLSPYSYGSGEAEWVPENNTIYENNIVNNQYGISGRSRKNKFYHNNFINNTQ
jgi:parallel beta-helix repeat protein